MELFGRVPDRLFSVLVSSKKSLYVQALFVIRDAFRAELQIRREDLLAMLTDSLENNISEADFTEEAEEEKPAERYYYTERYMPIPYQRALSDGMDRGYGRMWYDGNNSQDSGRTAGTYAGSGYMSRYYEDPRDMGGNDHRGYTMPVYDPREGRSPSRRKMYMESKEMHQPKEKQMQELESYMTELSGDIVDMIHGASPEERQMLQKKLAALATKID